MGLFMYASQFPMDDLLDSEQGSSPSIVSFFIGTAEQGPMNFTAEYIDGTYVPFVEVEGLEGMYYQYSYLLFMYVPLIVD